jgi:hypothetical protein
MAVTGPEEGKPNRRAGMQRYVVEVDLKAASP